MIGTTPVREFGAPVIPRPFGPSQPSPPMIQIIEMIRPPSVSRRSEMVRMNRRMSPATSSSASPISGPSAVSAYSRPSSSMTMYEMLLTRNGPSSADAIASILRSATSI